MFDFQFGEVQFRLAAREKSNSHPSSRKADRKPLADPASRAGDQGDSIVGVVQAIS
jgi:hypothetical protein